MAGALIGIGSTMVADRSRWKRDRRDHEQDVKRQVYAEYMAALSRSRREIRFAASEPGMEVEQRAQLARESFNGGSKYELRYQISVIAPEDVVDAAATAFHALRDLQDRVTEGHLRDSKPYALAREEYDRSFADLRHRIRSDIGSGNPRSAMRKRLPSSPSA